MKKITVVDRNRCRPDTCNYKCVMICPLNQSGKKKKLVITPRAIKVPSKSSFPRINNKICINCGICVNACFNRAIKVVNIPGELDEEPTHVYAESNFKLYGLPTIVSGKVTGLIGENGIGKSTLLNILAGKLKPNGGDITNAGFESFLERLSTPGMNRYLEEVNSGELTVVLKEQNLTEFKSTVSSPKELFTDKELENPSILNLLQVKRLFKKDIEELSGGELQRVAIAATMTEKADVYLLDEPATYLDISQRLKLVKILKLKINANRSIMVVEHDISVLDYYSDLIHILWGEAHVYGVVSRSLSVKKGLNSFLYGKLKEENIHFRRKIISFKRTVKERTWEGNRYFEWSEQLVRLGSSFELEIAKGKIYEGEILVILGENGLGKTTFANLLAGKLKKLGYPGINVRVSYKPQQIRKDFDISVLEFLQKTTGKYLQTKYWKLQLLRPLGIDHILDRLMTELSGGETQRVFITACLAKDADIYILDEPSAFLDALERTKIASVIRNQTKRNPASAVISIEHDIQLADFTADRVMLFIGVPAIKGKLNSPQSKREGMNTFLKHLNITFRRDPETGRARINKEDSSMDKRQKALGEYYYTL